MSILRVKLYEPYRCTESSETLYPLVPFYLRAENIDCCGIYLQGVQLDPAFRVSYVGQSRKFKSRLPGEFTSWLTGQDRRSRQAGELDPIEYCKGIRKYGVIPRDDEEMRRFRREILDRTLLFLGALPSGTEKGNLELVEGAFMRHLRSCPEPTSQFLYNKPTRSRRFSGMIEVEVPVGVRIEGLEAPFADVP